MSTAQVNSVAQYGGKYSDGQSNNAGGPQLTLPTGVVPVLLYGGTTGVSDDHRLVVYRSGGSTQQITTGKTFIGVGVYISCGSTAAVKWSYGYNLTGPITNNSATGAGDVFDSISGTDYANYTAVTANIPIWLPIPVTFPSASYPFIVTNGISTDRFGFVIVGYEI